MHDNIMANNSRSERRKNIHQNSDVILQEIEKSIDVLTKFINTSTDKKFKIDKSENRTHYTTRILESIRNRQFPSQKEIFNDLKNIDSSTLSKRMKNLVDNKVLAEINRSTDNLKKNSKTKKSYDFNIISFHLLKNINKLTSVIKNLHPLRLNNILDYKRQIINNGLYDMDEKSIIFHESKSTNLQYTIELIVNCDKNICQMNLCKRHMYNLFDDIIEYLHPNCKFDFLNSISIVKENENKCRIFIKIPKKDKEGVNINVL